MSSFKLDFLPKLPFNIKIPNNMTASELDGAIIGGILLGISASLYYFVFGKLIGRTSFIKQVSSAKNKNDKAIYATFIAGAICSSAFVKQLHHQHFIDFQPFDTKSFIRNLDEGVLAVAGFLVGMGTAFAGGCTVGHGVTGIARLKKASILSVIIFCAVAYLTMHYKLANYIPEQLSNKIRIQLPNNIKTNYYINACLTLPFIFFLLFKDKSLKGLIKYVLNFAIGVIFGTGMMVGGFTQTQLVLEAINFTKKYWNPTILVFISIAVIVCGIVINIISKNKMAPVFASEAENPNDTINFNLIFGSISFGIGWGLAGLCTASFYPQIPLLNLKIPFYWGISCFIGIQFVAIVQAIRNKIRKIK